MERLFDVVLKRGIVVDLNAWGGGAALRQCNSKLHLGCSNICLKTDENYIINVVSNCLAARPSRCMPGSSRQSGEQKMDIPDVSCRFINY